MKVTEIPPPIYKIVNPHIIVGPVFLVIHHLHEIILAQNVDTLYTAETKKVSLFYNPRISFKPSIYADFYTILLNL